jgi:protein gp37
MSARNLPGMRSPTTDAPFAVIKSDGPHWTGQVELIEHMLNLPLRWKKPRRIFVNSMSDVFHESLHVTVQERIFRVMLSAPQHDYLILTKRSELMAERVPIIMNRICGAHWQMPSCIWLGVSVEDRARKDRLDWLRKTPAAIRFVSFEPLLEDLGELNLAGISLAIWGGESGPSARPCDMQWIRNGMRQAKEQNCLNFVKQLGREILGTPELNEFGQAFRIERWKVPGGYYVPPIIGPNAFRMPREATGFRTFDRKGGDMDEWPEDLRVREMPEIRT